MEDYERFESLKKDYLKNNEISIKILDLMRKNLISRNGNNDEYLMRNNSGKVYSIGKSDFEELMMINSDIHGYCKK